MYAMTIRNRACRTSKRRRQFALACFRKSGWKAEAREQTWMFCRARFSAFDPPWSLY